MDPVARKEAARKARNEAAKKAKDAKIAARAARAELEYQQAIIRVELPPLTQEDIERRNQLDEKYKESVARKLHDQAARDTARSVEKRLQKVWRRVHEEKVRQGQQKAAKKDYLIQKEAYAAKIKKLVDARLMKMLHPTPKNLDRVRGLTSSEEKLVRTVRVKAGHYMHVIDALNCMREEDGPIIVFLKPGDKIVRKNFELTTENTSFKTETTWKVEAPNIHFEIGRKAKSNHNFSSPNIRSYNFANSTPALNLEYAFSDYAQSKNLSYSLPADNDNVITTSAYSLNLNDYNTGIVSYSFSSADTYDVSHSHTSSPALSSSHSRPSYSFTLDDDESSRISKYSFTIPDDVSNSYARFTIPDLDNNKKTDKKFLTKEEAVKKKEEIENIRNLLTLTFITKTEHDRRMEEVTEDGKWLESYIDAVVEVAEREERREAVAAARAASYEARWVSGGKDEGENENGVEHAPTENREPRKPKKGKKLLPGENGGAPRPGRKPKLTPEQILEKQRRAIEYEERKAARAQMAELRARRNEERAKLAEERAKLAEERAKFAEEQQLARAETIYEATGEPAVVKHIKKLKYSYTNGVKVCDNLQRFLSIYLPRDGDYSYLSSSHFTTDDESEKEYDADKPLVIRRKKKKQHRARRKRMLRITGEDFLDFLAIQVATPNTIEDVPTAMEEIEYAKGSYQEGLEHLAALKIFLYTLDRSEQRTISYDELERKYNQKYHPELAQPDDDVIASEDTTETNESRNQLHFFEIPVANNDDVASGAGDDIRSISNYSRDGASVMSTDDTKRVRFGTAKAAAAADDESGSDDNGSEDAEEDDEEGDDDHDDEAGAKGHDDEEGSDVDMEDAEDEEEGDYGGLFDD